MSKLLFTDGNELLSSGNNENFFDMQMYIIIKKYQLFGNGSIARSLSKDYICCLLCFLVLSAIITTIIIIIVIKIYVIIILPILLLLSDRK